MILMGYPARLSILLLLVTWMRFMMNGISLSFRDDGDHSIQFMIIRLPEMDLWHSILWSVGWALVKLSRLSLLIILTTGGLLGTSEVQ
jgi:hypothetical protein